MKFFTLHMKLIGMRILQGLEKVSVVALGILGLVTIVKTISNYIDTKTIPTFANIIIVVISIVGIIVMFTLKEIIEEKITEINSDIDDYKILRKHAKNLKQQYNYQYAEKKIKEENFETEKEDIPVKQFNVDKIKKSDIAELDTLIGLESVKEQVKKMRATIEYEKSQGGVKSKSVLHMKFTGNPGTGKTTVAKCMAAILYDTGIIAKPKYISVNGNDLMGAYTGHTAPTIDALFKQGAGGVIFIDEAYSLANAATNIDGTGYGFEAVNQLLTHLENNENKTIVIFGGYEEPINHFLNMNPGLRSRVPITIAFPDYSPDEMVEILEINLKKHGHTIPENIKQLLSRLFEEKIKHCQRYNLPFSNGRYARNVSDEIHAQHALNYAENNSIGATIIPEDIVFSKLYKLD